MRIRTWVFIGVAFLLAALGMPAASAAAAENLLANGGFEQAADDLPAGWGTDVWSEQTDSARFALDAGRDGGRAVRIENVSPADAKWIQSVAVEPDTIYKLSGWIKTQAVAEQATGANLSVLGSLDVSLDLKGTHTEWTEVALYGVTGSDQTELTVAARLGGYGSVTTGTAWFDDLSLTRVDNMPEGYAVASFDAAPTDDGEPASSGAGGALYAGIGVLYAAVAAWLLARLRQTAGGASSPSYRTGWGSPILWIAASALFIRLVGAVAAQGHPIDMLDFRFWSEHAAEHGLNAFYDGDIFADYPPGYIYVLYAIGIASRLLGAADGSALDLLLLKLPAMAADLVAVYGLYRLASKHWNQTAAIVIAALYAAHPVIWINSSVWGQIDGFFAAIVVAFVWQLDERRYRHAAVLFALAALVKPQAFMFAPLLLFQLIRERRTKPWIESAFFGLLAFAIPLIPFAYNRPIWWIVDLYRDTLASYPYATVNAFNLYALLGGNWEPIESRLLGLSYGTWGMLFIVATVATAGYWFFRSKRQAGLLPFVGFWISISVFASSAKMHERYVFPAFLLLLLVWIATRDKRWALVFGLLSAAQWINVSYVYHEAAQEIYHIPNGDPWMAAGSILLLAAWAATARIGRDAFIRGAIEEYAPAGKPGQADPRSSKPGARRGRKEESPEAARLFGEREAPPRITRLDGVWMVGILAVYLAVALVRLGDTEAPQTYWKPSVGGESFYADLGDSRTITRIVTYGGAGMGGFRVQVSEDAESWETYGEVEQSHADVFIWKPVESAKGPVDARYVRFLTTDVGYILNEAAVFGERRERLEIVRIVPEEEGERTLGSPGHVFDEQQWTAWKADVMNSTYFDEIYHGRTAYEFLEKLEPYETTHPPLGKVIQSFGIWLFGMTPFGWRIVGTVVGALLLPLMYVMAKTMFRSTRWAVFATLFFAADFMHFAQTRMGTVDTYIVLFVMLMYYWMYRYTQMNMYRDGLWRTLVPLGLAGLCFGLGIAVKWNAMYGGVGLAALFFHSLWLRWKEARYAQRELAAATNGPDPNRAERLREAAVRFPKYAVLTLAACVLFYIVVPIMVYAASYIPYMNATNADDDWRDLWRYQTNMYEYHSELEATHPFESPWYEWPVIGRPLWLFGGDELPEGTVATIVDMGNPAVWWAGFAAFLASAAYGLLRRDKNALFLLVAFASLYVPWIVSPRTLTFIYHYFPMTPFVILFLVFGLRLAEQRFRRGAYLAHGLAAAAIVLFALYYPALTGLEIPREYAQNVLKWFDAWDFF